MQNQCNVLWCLDSESWVKERMWKSSLPLDKPNIGKTQSRMSKDHQRKDEIFSLSCICLISTLSEYAGNRWSTSRLWIWCIPTLKWKRCKFPKPRLTTDDEL